METAAGPLTSSRQQINVLVMIDTELVKNYVKVNKITPSKDPKVPTSLTSLSRAGQYMLVTGSRPPAPTGQGTGSVGFTAHPGDTVAFCGVSGYANAEDAVIVYKIEHKSGDKILDHFQTIPVTITGAAFPDASKTDGLPAVNAKATFTTLNGNVGVNITGPDDDSKTSYEETFYIYFGLYVLDDDSGQKQVLFGYFDCDPIIKVPKPPKT